MKTSGFVFFLIGSLLFADCGILSGTNSTEIMLDGYSVSIEYETARFGDTDRIADLYQGSTFKLGDEKPAIFKSDSNLFSGFGYVYEGAHSIWLRRGLKDHWYLLFNRNTEAAEYEHDYDATILPLSYSTDPVAADDLSITLIGSGEEGTIVIRWGVHRFEMDVELPPLNN
ncbi:MAG: hypothetical protein VYA69_11320 [Gemmatimonadota bacterium]|nr:hypothetical protein [Gemmatimonadota bacterium]